MMRKCICVLLSLVALLALSGCHKPEAVPEVDAPEPVVTEYDLEEARAMIDEAEWLTAWLYEQKSIQRSAAEKLVERIDTTMLHDGVNTLNCALEDAAYWDDESMDVLPLGNGTVAPTIYHEDVELVSAIHESSCVLDEETGECINHYFDTLRIRKEYTGNDPAFQGWYLEYVFNKPWDHDSDGDWVYIACNGTYNLVGDLPLRSDFDFEKYPTP